MSKRVFSKEQIEVLSKNKYVKKASEKEITYIDDFKGEKFKIITKFTSKTI